MAKKLIIEPKVILTLYVEFNKINIVIKDISGFIIKLISVPIIFGGNKLDEHKMKQNLAVSINQAIEEQNVDTILLESCKLSIDKINMFPDPYILRNILLQYSVQVTIEDNFIDKVEYFFEVPQKEWLGTIFNRNSIYSIDLFKHHILQMLNNEDELLKIIDAQNYYRVLCFSESINYTNLANRKYLINKEDI